jgi:sulfite reductase (NADPH) flavoprotein alpha-component
MRHHKGDAVVLQSTNSPFSDQQAELLNRLLPTLTPVQMSWLGGYMSGVCGGPQAAAAGPSASPTAADGAAGALEVTLLYGSQTGNSMHLAKELAGRLQQRGLVVDLSCMSQYQTKSLRKAKHLLVVISTHGEGEPPDKAITFCEFLHGKRAPRLEGVGFSVLALGDITYKNYCKTGRDIDRRLEELGATRVYAQVDCDVDYDEPAQAWMEAVVAALGREQESAAARPASTASVAAATALKPTLGTPAFGRTRPFQAEVLENLKLNGRGSDKQTHQLKLSLKDSGLSFEPGDSVGIYPENHADLVDKLIAEMGFQPDELVPAGKQSRPLREALLKHYEITVLSRPLLQNAAVFSHDGLQDLVGRGCDDEIRAYMFGRDLLDLVRDFSLRGVPAQDFVSILRKMPPRLYSIASSCQANPDEVDLLIVALRYHAQNRDRFGTCSVYCADQVQEGDRLSVYVHDNPNFRMPPDPDAPMIMVGPGTGVAPFRAFLEQREESGARGKNWLFFGDRRFRTDFLCQTEWLRWRRTGLLTHMDVAFSRDIEQKVYVQHRMLNQGREIFDWLDQGAYFYVCGDEKHMAPDVHSALQTIVEREGGMDPAQAQAYLADLQQQNRYQRDVY